MTVVLEIATKPADRARFTEEGEIALAGLLEVDRGLAFQAYTEPELTRLTNRLDTEDRIVVDGATWSGFPELAFYLDEKPSERWEGSILDIRASLLSEHGRALGAGAIAQATNGVRRLGPDEDPGEQMAAADPASAIEALRADATLVRDVYLFGRDFGYVQVERKDEPGFELLEVDW